MLILLVVMVILLTTLRIKIEYKREKENDRVHMEIQAWKGLIRYRQDIPALELQNLKIPPVTEKAWESPVNDQPLLKKKSRPTQGSSEPSGRGNKLKAAIRFAKHVRHFRQIVQSFLKKIKLEHFEWRTGIGTGEAADTGVFSGLIWAVKGSIVGTLSHLLTLRAAPRLRVDLAFQQPFLSTHLVCIVRLRIGHAIIAAIRMLFNYRKRA